MGKAVLDDVNGVGAVDTIEPVGIDVGWQRGMLPIGYGGFDSLGGLKQIGQIETEKWDGTIAERGLGAGLEGDYRSSEVGCRAWG